MGKMNPVDLVSDVVGMSTFGTFNIKKMRFNVPFSGAMVGDYLKSIGNFATLGQLRPEVNDFFSTPTAKMLETVAGAVILAVGTAGVASALAAPAAAGTAGVTPLAAGGVAPTIGAGVAPAVGSAASGSSVIGAALGTGGAAVPAVGSAASGSSVIGAALGTGAPAATSATAPSLAASVAPTAVSGVSAMAPGASTSVPQNDLTAELNAKTPALNSTPTKGWFESLSPGAQTALVTGGFAAAQLGTGAMSGLFQGVSAQKKLELEQLINEQNQNQVQYLNKNNAYAPLLTFTQPAAPAPGLTSTIGKV